MKKIDYDVFIEELQSGDVYFINTFEDAAIRSVNEGTSIRYYIKFRDSDEFLADNGNRVVAEAIREHTILSKQEYDSF